MTKYNGWTNYETWNFKLWLDNDQDVHNYIIDEIKKIKVLDVNLEAGRDLTSTEHFDWITLFVKAHVELFDTEQVEYPLKHNHHARKLLPTR